MATPLIDGCYYWVQWGGQWKIAQWDEDGLWWFCGSEVPKDKDDVDEVHHTALEGPEGYTLGDA